MSRDEITRREFLKRALMLGAGGYALTQTSLLSLLDGVAEAAPAGGRPTIVVASKKTIAGRTKAAVQALGGMKKFVKRGATVLIKPNMAWARRPEQAANTNPEVVAELVRLCRAAGAREVKVADHPVDGPADRVIRLSGIGPAAEKAGARVFAATSPVMFQKITLKRGKVLKRAETMRDLLRADVVINVPIAKVHGSTKVTLGCKNLMGTVLDRGAWHQSRSLDQCIADYAAQIKPDLIVLDATRVLLSNGPKGPGRTKQLNLVVAGTDPVAVDAYGVKLLGSSADKIGHLKRAAAMGLGQLDLNRVNIKRV